MVVTEMCNATQLTFGNVKSRWFTVSADKVLVSDSCHPAARTAEAVI